MLKNFWLKVLLYVVITLITFYFFNLPSLLETAFAEELTSQEPEKKIVSSESDSNNSSKTWSAVLWEYRWYVLGTSIVLLSSLALIIYFSSGSTPPPPPPVEVMVMPHVRSQTILELLALNDPRICMDVNVTRSMPDILKPDAPILYADRSSVADPNFWRGFICGEQGYQMYMMPEGPYDDETAVSWMRHAQATLGNVVFPSPDYTFMYTKVAIIPVDTFNYTVYHKIDIVKVIPDPGHMSIPQIKVSVLFKDTEINWAQ